MKPIKLPKTSSYEGENVVTAPKIAKQRLLQTADVPRDTNYGGLRIVRYQSDSTVQKTYDHARYQFQHQREAYSLMRAVLSRKGTPPTYRFVVTLHPTLRQFVDVVKYDPSNPPPEDYQAQGMKEAHERTQSDFKGAKRANTRDFKEYILEGIGGERTLHLPTVSGWQSEEAFEQTVFVAFDDADANAIYGMIYPETTGNAVRWADTDRSLSSVLALRTLPRL